MPGRFQIASVTKLLPKRLFPRGRGGARVAPWADSAGFLAPVPSSAAEAPEPHDMTDKAASTPTLSVWFLSGEKVLEVSSELPCVAVWKLKEEIANVTGATPAQQKLLRGARVLGENENLLARGAGGAPHAEGGLDVQLVIAPERGNERSSTPTRMPVGWNGYGIDDHLDVYSNGSLTDDGAEGAESAFDCVGCECLDGVWHLQESSRPAQPGWQMLRIKDGEVVLGSGRSTFVTRLAGGQFMLSGAVLEFDGLTIHRHSDDGHQCFEYTGPTLSAKNSLKNLPGQPEFSTLMYPMD